MISHLLRELILPPGSLLILFLASFLLRRKAPRFAVGLFATAFLALYLLSIPPVSLALSHAVERERWIGDGDIKVFQPQAIVILGGGAESETPEYGGITVPTESSLRRVEYGAFLARRTKLPVLVSGGYGKTRERSEAWAMKTNLESYGIDPRWVEAQGTTTAENASFSSALLKPAGVEKVLVVTEASHARRARLTFEKAGLKVLVAPTGFRTSGPWDEGLMRLVPAMKHLAKSSDALREAFSVLWYQLRGAG